MPKSQELDRYRHTVKGTFNGFSSFIARQQSAILMCNTRSKKVATSCMEMYNFPLPSVCKSNRKYSFLRKLSVSDNGLCAEYANYTVIQKTR